MAAAAGDVQLSLLSQCAERMRRRPPAPACGAARSITIQHQVLQMVVQLLQAASSPCCLGACVASSACCIRVRRAAVLAWRIEAPQLRISGAASRRSVDHDGFPRPSPLLWGT